MVIVKWHKPLRKRIFKGRGFLYHRLENQESRKAAAEHKETDFPSYPEVWGMEEGTLENHRARNAIEGPGFS
jgi:hypothetical protein